jgi:hypothetical protein
MMHGSGWFRKRLSLLKASLAYSGLLELFLVKPDDIVILAMVDRQMMRKNVRMQKVAMRSKMATLRRAGLKFKTRDIFQGSKIDETRDAFQA